MARYKVNLYCNGNSNAIQIIDVEASSEEEAIQEGFENFCWYYEHYLKSDSSKFILDLSRSNAYPYSEL